MNKFIDSIGVLLLLAVILIIALTVDAKGKDTYTADYIGNYDADTITMFIHAWDEPPVFVETAVRVSGIDAPEIRGKCDTEKALAREAKQFVEDVLSHSDSIELRVIGKGKYGRLLVDVTYDGSNLATDLVDLGYAVPYDGKTRRGWCDAEV